MMFQDIISEKGKVIDSEIKNLFEKALKCQSHPGDLLLLLINGYLTQDVPKGDSPYVFGIGREGWSEHTHFDFIDLYRTESIHDEPYSEYIKKHEWDPARQQEIEQLTYVESISLHVEMMIYLKIWEADMTIKKLCELVRILNGEHFDWHFRISESNRNTDATGLRHEIIRKLIRDKIRPCSEIVYKVIKDAYITQLRNSIAHSNYSFLGRHIHLNNYVKNDPASQLTAVSFDQWIDLFHNTIMLQNGLIGLSNLIWKHYSESALANRNLNEIRIIKADGAVEIRNVYYRSDYKVWAWESQMT